MDQNAPDRSYVIGAYSGKELTSVTRYSSTPSQVASTTHGYAPHGRLTRVTDARNGATAYGCNAADQVTNVTTLPPRDPGTRASSARRAPDFGGAAWRILATRVALAAF